NGRLRQRHPPSNARVARDGVASDDPLTPGVLAVEQHAAALQFRSLGEKPLNRPIGKIQARAAFHEALPLSELRSRRRVPLPLPTGCRARDTASLHPAAAAKTRHETRATRHEPKRSSLCPRSPGLFAAAART